MQSSNPLVATLHEWLGIFRRSLMGNFFTYARNNGLTMAQFGTMLHIFHKGACGVSDIGNDLGVTNSAASQMLERMVHLRLISRSEDQTDRRVKQIVLTDKGRQIIEESSLAFQAWMENLAGIMTSEEQEQVKDALVILIEKANQLKITPIDKSD
jgi:MarR family transcriptional regulator, organic hydroperoxide resistance regulator